MVSLVEEDIVADWDDPRLPTIAAMRRRGFPSVAIQDFCDRIGVAKRDTTIPLEYLESCVRYVLSSIEFTNFNVCRNALHATALRRHVVLNPLKVIITNFESESIPLECPNHPEDLSFGYRTVS